MTLRQGNGGPPRANEDQQPPHVPEVSGLHPIGRGGFATVYSGTQARLGREVAVKVFHATVMDPWVRQQFDAECAAVGSLPSDIDIVHIYSSGVVPGSGQPYLVMELCTGSLGERIAGQGALAAAEVAALGYRLALALAGVHRAALLHRDVTPRNVLFRRSGQPVLADFGLSLGSQHADRTQSHATWAYAAPEIWGGSASNRSDIYGLGATLYAALTGGPPFPRRAGEDDSAYAARIRDDSVPPIRVAGVPDGLPALIAQLLAKDPRDRPADADAVAIGLAAFCPPPGRVGPGTTRAGGAALPPAALPPAALPPGAPVPGAAAAGAVVPGAHLPGVPVPGVAGPPQPPPGQPNAGWPPVGPPHPGQPQPGPVPPGQPQVGQAPVGQAPVGQAPVGQARLGQGSGGWAPGGWAPGGGADDGATRLRPTRQVPDRRAEPPGGRRGRRWLIAGAAGIAVVVVAGAAFAVSTLAGPSSPRAATSHRGGSATPTVTGSTAAGSSPSAGPAPTSTRGGKAPVNPAPGTPAGGQQPTPTKPAPPPPTGGGALNLANNYAWARGSVSWNGTTATANGQVQDTAQYDSNSWVRIAYKLNVNGTWKVQYAKPDPYASVANGKNATFTFSIAGPVKDVQWDLCSKRLGKDYCTGWH